MQSQALTISPKYQVVIPQEVRAQIGLVPGQRVRWLIHEGMLVLVPVLTIDEMRGYLKDHDIRLIRDKEKFEP
ncbi:MAG: AbrB/MazE/SpoVT family DNA-binding domain-containing protein [Ignavibacteria bacterium]|nr:AbrB/MazE/SpoVT family DNA-binding domain-containing protein [Ignavibacteria bacterium]MBP6509806.1 AbrB/MazE/SpoVT family DNA-binding domain-containing protein [Candidatus Kapabacteria bacterium]HLP27626.1 AbrB/MazE/SpoVT family DNA-binding domain-containing protein [Candidatus Didemnitutus sp.]MBK6419557.1 AbrB/MazE/SpoVT family DNA-binding domain-containing protein [Ignavibacteria bacterium]MBK6759820.1 AbrB/MazE/SpoVT family DNA-binding domain-containing protein [Ignavibacteria bacterium